MSLFDINNFYCIHVGKDVSKLLDVFYIFINSGIYIYTKFSINKIENTSINNIYLGNSGCLRLENKVEQINIPFILIYLLVMY